MRIGVDGSCWLNNRGFGRFTRALLPELFVSGRGHEFIVLTDDTDAAYFEKYDVDVVKIATNRKVIESAKVDDRRSVFDVFAFTQSAGRQSLDLIYYPAVYSWFPPPRNIPSVVTFHDAIAEHFPELVFPHAKERYLWNAKTWLAKKSCDRVLTVSQTAKREIVDYLGIKPGKIDVICEGADAIFAEVDDQATLSGVRTKFGLPLQSRLLIYVGGFAPHKNLLRLLAAFSRAIETSAAADLHLVMVGDADGGGFHSAYEELTEKVKKTENLQDRVHFAGYVCDEDLAALYSDSLALILPSLSEGFGLPALEAMSCGTPVLAAREGAVMEVAGAAGHSFNPLDADDIARAIIAIASDTELLKKLRIHAKPETARNRWPRAAELTLDALEACYRTASCAS
jgi:glycosyltransferase involved in cell wall biosynthesis